MKKNKPQDIKNDISMTIEEFYDLHKRVIAAYNNAGCDDIIPDEDYEKDMIYLVSTNGKLSASIFIKLSTRESIEIFNAN